MSLEQIQARSAELDAIGTSGISTEAIEALLAEIAAALDQVELGDQKTWDALEALRTCWGRKLQALEAYLGR